MPSASVLSSLEAGSAGGFGRGSAGGVVRQRAQKLRKVSRHRVERTRDFEETAAVPVVDGAVIGVQDEAVRTWVAADLEEAREQTVLHLIEHPLQVTATFGRVQTVAHVEGDRSAKAGSSRHVRAR